MNKITPFLWFDDNGAEAMDFYMTVFPDAEITSKNMMPGGKFFTGSMRLNNQDFMVLNAGPQFKFNEAVSFFISCKTQEEVDMYWTKLSDGGEESNCGWVKDKFGLWWQVVPEALNECLSNPDREKAGRAMEAMMKMKKIIISDLENA
jgi:predicted 3-demethylubiquinone-9 3-methyltransferase (glyoxalase superfamily)